MSRLAEDITVTSFTPMASTIKVKPVQTYVSISTNCEFKLSEAVLVYRGGSGGAFASLHRVRQTDDEVPYLAPGELLTTAFLRRLAQGLGAQVKPEIFPENNRQVRSDESVKLHASTRCILSLSFGGLE